MLISHRKAFIFTKTVKTAGTSVESYFEQYCMPEGEWKESHSREEYISEAGIIGFRGQSSDEKIWYNHMSAKKIRDQIGQEIWDKYFKFTVVRNPYDKLISGFYFHRKYNKQKYSKTQRLIAYARSILNVGGAIDRIQKKKEIELFRSWIINGGEILDKNKYMIDGELCIDYFIRFENLHEDIKHVCDQLSIPFEPSRIPEFKKGVRKHIIPIQDFYDSETKQIVLEKYAWEIDRFAYDIPK